MTTTTSAPKRSATPTTGLVQSISALQGTQREYETVTILRPEIGKAEIRDLVERMQETFTRFDARLVKIDSWGMRILAYPIKHCRKGLYLYWRYVGGSDVVAEFERLLRYNDKVIRHYSVRIGDDIDPEARPSEVTEDVLEAVSEPGPDPDEVARRQAEARARAEAAAAVAAAQAAAARKEYGYDDEDSDDDDDDEDE